MESRLLFAAPLAPTNLLATALSSNQIDLKWVDQSSNETGFAIQRAVAGGGFSTVATVGANATVFHDSNLPAGSKFGYRVVALSGEADSAPSYPTIGNTLELFQVNGGHTEPQRVGGYQWGLPSQRADLLTEQRNNVFYEGQPVVFTLQWNYGQATSYEVRNYWGEMVDSGPAPAPEKTLSVNVSKPGWYKIYLYSSTSVEAAFGDVIGGTMFLIFRNDPNFPALPAKSVVTTNPGSDEVMRGVTGMGPQRHNVTNALDPDGMIASLAPEIEFDKQYYLPYDPVRKRDLLIAFSNGTRNWSDRSQDQAYLDGVRKIVQRFHNDVKYFEGRNEPNFFVSPEQYVDELRDLYNVVKSVDPTSKVIGPGCVDLASGYGLAWLDQFLAAGGGQYIDAVSFHVYNNVNGDLSLARQSFDGLQAVLTKYGLQNIEKWQTEQGAFAALYGSYQPRLQGRWDMLQMLVQEQYGITKEHNHLWYDRSGFWDVPAFWEVADDNSLNPAAALMRVYSEEVYGTTFSKAYDFGPSGNKLFLGNLYTGPSGKAVAAFMSAGSSGGQVMLKVQGGSSLKVTNAMGVSSTLAVSNGTVVLNVPEVPVYVELAPGQTVEVVPQDFGVNLARQSGVTLASSGDGQHPAGAGWLNSISKVTNGKLDTWYGDQSADGDVWYDNTPEGQPTWLQINLPKAQTVDRVTVFSGVPWSWRGTLLDYELQYESGGNWVTIEHVQQTPKTIGVYSPWLRSTVDSFFSDQWIFQHEFSPVTTSKLRLLVHDQTYGGGATKLVQEAGGQTGFHKFNLREVEVYGTGNVTVPPPITATASVSFVKTDATAQGNWKGVYGGEGFGIVNNALAFPSYAQVDPSEALTFTWNGSTSDVRAIERSGGSGRIASTWYGGNYTFDVNLTDGKGHQMALYFLDWDNQGRSQRLEILDAGTGNVLDSRNLSSFVGGKYLVYNVSGHVKIRVSLLGGANSVLSGIYFGPGPQVAAPPVADDDVYSSNEDHALSVAAGGVLANDRSSSGNTLRAVLVNGPAHAAAFSLNADGSFSYTPGADFNGTDTFTYKVNDGADSNIATVTLRVAEVNDAPAAGADARTAARGTALTFAAVDLLVNDSAGPANESGQALSVVSVAALPDTHGSVVLNGDGTITYTPDAGYSGAARFSYTLRDDGTSNGVADPRTASGIVNMEIRAQAPVASAGGNRTADEGSTVSFDGSGSYSPDGLPLTYSWDFGDGSTATGITAAHAYADNGTYTFSLTVSDGTFTRNDVRTIIVNNVAPTATLSGSTVTQGSAGTVTFSSAGDASAADLLAGLRYSFDFNNDGVFEVVDSVSASAVVPASYLTTAGDHAVRGRVRDKDGGYGDYSTAVRVSPAPPAPAGTFASLVKLDTVTQGNWRGVYGLDGYGIPNDALLMPVYAQASTSGALSYTWAAPTGDPRALQTVSGSGRIASTLYGGSFSLDLSFTDGQAHQVALYFLDWDNQNRSEKVEAVDAASGAVLDSRDISAFVGGKWLVYNMSGQVRIRVSLLGGANSVLGGVFFGGAATTPGNQAPVLANSSVSLADVVQNDQGNGGSSITSLLTSLTVSDGDAGALRGVAITAADHANGAWQYSTDSGATWSGVGAVSGSSALLLTDAAANRLRFVPAQGFAGTASLSLRAWDQTTGAPGSRADTTVNGGTAAFSSAIATVNVKVVVPSSGTSARFLGADSTTQGNWKGSYGSDGYGIANDGVTMPPYGQATTSGALGYTWASPTSDPRALQTAWGSGRIASTLYGGSFSLDLCFTDGQAHQVSLYFLDWDRTGRSEKVEIVDAVTGAVLDSRSVADFADGKYLSYLLSGHVTIRLTMTGGANAVLSGVFFD